MQKYRAIVIDGKKVIRRAAALVTGAVVGVLFIIGTRFSGVELFPSQKDITQKVIGESIPQTEIGAQGTTWRQSLMSKLYKGVTFLMTFDPADPRTIFFGHIPMVHTVSQSYLASVSNGRVALVFNPVDADKGMGDAEPAAPSKGEHPICEVDSSQAKALGNSKNKILIRNETDFGINIDEMLGAPLSLDMHSKGPKVLILHTHATESYSPEGASTYSADKSDRSLDTSQNMIAVGEAVKRVFDEAGIDSIHDKTLHDQPSFNGSYANSLKTVEKYKAKYPSICVVLDLHRDAFIYENGSKAKFVTEINGKKTAQLMMVVGTNGGGLDHPAWRENMKFALKLQNQIIDRYPSLMRGVNLRKERFNGHTTHGSMIIEVGSSGNTLAEAIRGATLGAGEIARFLKGL